ncbi:mercury(II) reductase [Paraburkholderia fungorum]|uniref:Mercuric reductase n=1 Tax=Paraburkholderia fungorum TaxID=134537 RepID=A0AAW3V220_9BURK|nr:mercury(II) reductase [Paraburkholderia fungorum]MBB4517490.1 mercuric reductase [Paraburkholderia fungorum]MBB6204558.1 mercuric reductase [Paraburkholderia fungorum]
MIQRTFRITGMTCDHCARTIEQALNAVSGVAARVSFEQGLASVDSPSSVEVSQLIAAIPAPYGATLLEGQSAVAESVRRDARGLHIAIVGGGSAAFACAIRGANEGARVTIIETAEVGGTCVNVGCVPSKIMIRGADIAHLQSAHPFDGIERHTPAIDRASLVAQQQARVHELRQVKYQHIVDANANITLLRGSARFVDASTLLIKRPDGTETRLGADRVLIATGAAPAIPPVPGLQQTPFWTSTEALVAETVPEHLIVLGGSVVGLEIGQAFLHLGARVTVIELFSLLPKFEPEIGAGLRQILEHEGARVMTQTEITHARFEQGQFILEAGAQTVSGDRLLVATGRRPNTAALGLADIGVATERSGAVAIDDHLRTSVEHIYAAGDCTNLPQFVYVAAAAGTRAAVNMTGGDAALDLATMPSVVFTSPQVASVGLTEQEAADRGLVPDTRTLAMTEVPRALANFDTRGFIKLVADRNTGRLLGVHILAAEAGEIIQSAALALRNHMSVRDLADQLFPYLTMVEGLKLCAQTFTMDVKQLSCCAG